MGSPSVVASPGPAAAASRRPALTIDRVWTLLPFLVPVLVSMMSRMVAIDLAYHVRAGELLASTAHIPSVDTFTFTIAGRPWFDQQWGAQLLLALLYRAGGWATVSVFRAILIGGTFTLVYLSCRARGAEPAKASALTLAGFIVALQALAMRPQLFAIALFAGSMWALATRAEHPRRAWLVPVLTIVWANVHGSFVLGPLLIFLACLEDVLGGRRREARRLVPVAVATLLATAVTPFGPLVWRYAYQLTANPVVRNNVTEWAAVTVRSFGGAAFFASAVAVSVYLARRRGATGWADLIWLTAFFVLALPAIRGIVWWSLVAPVVVAGGDGRAEAGPDRLRVGTPALNRLLVGVLGVAILAALPWWRASSATSMLSQAPVGLSDAAGRMLPAGTRLFVSEPWGSWFEQSQPQLPVFADPRIEIFPTSLWNDYTELRNGGVRWQTILDAYRVQAVVVDRQDFPRLLQVMQGSPSWRAAYANSDGVLFVRAAVPAPAG